MKTAAILLATLGLAVAGAAAASDHLTDVDYLKANRCAGLAAGLGSSDVASLNALVKTEGRSRVEAIYTKGQEEEAKAKKAASSTDSRERLTAELNGPCMAYLGGGSSTASANSAAKNASSSH
jgi:hypothetical protein